ncbi:MAG: MBL fold metallo-hydrolase [Nitrospinaceae bacterium]|nr:MAG: MBL fold metallo-hydrolase [Nitrospinaceae bacterium]
MFFKQYYLGCLAHASYLIGDESTQTAVVVDPQRDIEQYLNDAEKNDLRIRHVILTHFHADFVAGHLELRDRAGAEIHLGARAEAEYAFKPQADGSRLDLGRVSLEFLETPGHTPEGISILVFDHGTFPDKPLMVLTGDTLFIGDVGRPDLMASEGISETELAGLLYDSLRNKLMPLPDATKVYPAHGAGSLCGRNLSDETVSTIGEQKALNYALGPMTREAFIALVTENQPQAPEYFSYDARLNKKERPRLEESLQSGTPLSLDGFLEGQAAGAQVLDTRPQVEFSAAHLPGAVHVGLGGKFATWAGIVLDPQVPILLVAEPGSEYEAQMRLGRIGFDRVAGYLDGGMQAANHRPNLLEPVISWTGGELLEALSKDPPPHLLDVRAESEFRAGHIKKAIHVPLNNLVRRLGEIPKGGTVVVHCAGGYRSTIACSLLQKHGYRNVVNLLGGIAAFENLGSEVEAVLAR